MKPHPLIQINCDGGIIQKEIDDKQQIVCITSLSTQHANNDKAINLVNKIKELKFDTTDRIKGMNTISSFCGFDSWKIKHSYIPTLFLSGANCLRYKSY